LDRQWQKQNPTPQVSVRGRIQQGNGLNLLKL
jgi:hypothetical protein